MKLNKEQSALIRESYNRTLIPKAVATWLTGKPCAGQKPLFKLHWILYVAFVLAIFFLSYIGGFYNQVADQSIAIMLLCWAGLVFSTRRMAAVILHQSVHERLSGNGLFDKLLGDFVTLLMLTQDYETYKVDHCKIHHGPLTFATKYDPIVQFFSVFGIDLGAKKQNLYLNFFISIFSPIFHLSFFITRLGYNISAERSIRSLLSIAYIAALLAVPYYLTGGFSALFFAFIVPVVFLYQISAFIEICSEHAWFENNIKSTEDLLEDPYFYSDISWGRFCGSKYPEKGIISKLKWYFVQLFYHLPVRLFILVGDLPQHDYHHRKPLCFDWVNARYNREKALYNLAEGEPEYIDIWGIHNAIEHVFGVVSEKDPNYISDFNSYSKEARGS
ncbi:hypothetical protein CWB99_17720 [Pseudoalteromonas rubra]|uniref:Fatty acid desaturase domain-containing protein n=1 Tax=Pseudoalteromonas rubra TaxID=43658 RepID=A0A5S3WHY2_9GAMM|nr:fatty acid desaturase [Pseudoalteromonas rubra]TMP26700.1 hypothetical protein CWB99_17720 [Pseudoalteromonas rubra]TMP30676.1 hypothetical protein CWC00_15950 [Pseudoalteromonas rubra]